MEKSLAQNVIAKIAQSSRPDRPVYLAGGSVRDQLLNRPLHDLDFALPGPTRRLAKAIADELDGAFYVMDEERDTTRVVLNAASPENRLMLDFASLRAGDIEGDLVLRDFTINAMAYDVAHPDALIDPTGGFADLREKRIRACSPSSFQNDPARVLRAVRQGLALGFRIESETLRLARAAAPLLKRVSAERQRDELFKMLGGRQVAQAVYILDQLGALPAVLPDLDGLKGVSQSAPHVNDVWNHTLSVLRYLEQLWSALVGAYNEDAGADLITGLAVMRLGRFRDRLAEHFAASYNVDRSMRALLFLAALYHDISKPATRTVEEGGRARFFEHEEVGAEVAAQRGRELALSNDEVQRLEKIVRQHMRIHFLASDLKGPEAAPSRRSIYRYFRDCGPAGVDICLLSLADLRATYEINLPQDVWLAELNVCRALLEGYWEQSESVVAPARLVTGDDLMREFKLKPGPVIGRLLEAIREGQVVGEINDREGALEFTRRWLDNPPASGERD